MRSAWRLLMALVVGFGAVIGASPSVEAAAAKDRAKVAGRPTIGLVLSGGGALGATHIGVIKVLEELNVPIDIVVGTSMGSIVGGLYSMGLNAQELESLVANIDWAGTFEDRPPRENRSFRRKSEDYGFLLDLKVGIKDGGIQLPPGIIQGQRLTLMLRSLTVRARDVTDFDDLPKRYRAVAADLETGREVVLSGGNIATAMRASMSVPGVFPPVEIGDKLLVDGGVANNLPVSVARRLGADIVIVVDIPTILKKRDELKSTLDIAGQMLSVLIQQNSLSQMASLGPRDILIQPELGKLSAADFGRIMETVKPGEVAARKQTERLAALARGEVIADQSRGGQADRVAQARDETLRAGRPIGGGSYGGGGYGGGGYGGPVGASHTTHGDGRGAVGGQRLSGMVAGETPVIHFIEIENRTKLSDERIRRMINQKVGEPLDLAQVEKDFTRLYGLGDFEQIDYSIVEKDGRTGMRVVATEKSWARDYFRVGLALDNDFNGGSSFTLGGDVTFTALDPYGAEWRSSLSIGEEQRLYTEWYQPLQPEQGFFLLPQARYLQRRFYGHTGKNIDAEYQVTTADVAFMVGLEMPDIGLVTTGLRFGAGDIDRVSTGALPAGQFFNIGQFEARFIADTIDDFSFPHSGHFVIANLVSSHAGLGGEEDYSRIEINANQAFEIGSTSMIIGGRFGTALSGDLPAWDQFGAGGLFNLSGYARNEVTGAQLAGARILVSHSLTDRSPLAMNMPLYVGGSLEFIATDENDGDDFNNRHYGGSLFVGADTPLGPLYLGYGLADGGRQRAYLYLGKLF